MEPMTDYNDPVAEFMWPLTGITEPVGDSDNTEPRIKAEEPSQVPYDTDAPLIGHETLGQKAGQTAGLLPITVFSDAQYQFDSSGDGEHLSGSLEDREHSSNNSSSSFSSSSASEDSVPDGQNPIAYARYYGLCRDYKGEHLLDTDLIPLPDDDQYADLGFDMSAVHQTFNERLDVDKDTAAHLSSVLSMGRVTGEGDEYDLARRLKRLKIEAPVLQIDHDADMLRLRRKSCVKISSKGLTPFKLDISKDEGPEFPPQCAILKSEIDRKIKDARLDLTAETIDYLKEIYEFPTEEEPDLADQAYQEHKKRCKRSDHLTPPLEPPTPLLNFGQPASEAMVLEATSTPEDLLARDNADIQQALLKEDKTSPTLPAGEMLPQSPSLGQSHELLDSFIAGSSSSSPLERKRLRNLKLESPLIPRDESSSPAKKPKTVGVPPEVSLLIPQPDTDSSAQNTVGTSDEINAFVQNVATPFAEAVNRQAMNEQLSEVDTTMRIKAPDVEPVEPQPPWVHFADAANDRMSAQQLMLRQLSKELLVGQEWSCVRKLERGMFWTPFPPGYGRVDCNETFDDGSCERYLAALDLEGEIDVDALIARMSHLQVLEDHDVDNEYVEPALLCDGEGDPANERLARESEADTAAAEKASLDSVTRKTATRKTAQPSVSDAGDQSNKDDLFALLRRKKQLLEGQSLKTSNALSSNDGSDPWQDAPFSNAVKPGASAGLMQNNGLANFMHLHGKDAALRKTAGIPSRVIAESVAGAAVMVPKPAVQVLQRPTLQLPAPELREDSSIPQQIVLSTAFMANRHMVRQLQVLLPHAELVERDTSDVLREAELTLSPSTGLMTATLQKLKQRPLPGQGSFVGVRERIAAVALRYEHLVVLVSEGTGAIVGDRAGLKALDQRDCDEVTDLIESFALMDTTVEITYIAGGEAELVKWIAAAVRRHSIAGPHSRLLQEETMWERFLRRAGMNAYAAQVVMAELKIPDAEVQPGSSFYPASSPPAKYGLAAFIAMSADERLQRFATLLGGGSVIRRVTEVMDRVWSARNARLSS